MRNHKTLNIPWRRFWACILLGTGLAATAGCAVPQPRGDGLYRRVQEPTTKAWYHLYLPVDYVKRNGVYPDSRFKKWPLVMTFHGMKPYDNARPQEREWEKEADVYGYIVCAPELNTCDSFMEYPLTQEHDYVLRDKRNVIAIMNHVFATTRADPKRVLSTSWSCGGYFAHYFPNRFPDRFSCIVTRLSNFSPKLLIEKTVPLYKDKTGVAIFIGDGDFPACKTESEEAVAWYMARGFKVVRGKMIDRMGHRRIPQVAAAFFAEQLGIQPQRPLEAATSLGRVQMTEYHPPQQMVLAMAPRRAPLSKRPIVVAGARTGSRQMPPRLPPPRRRRSVTYVSTNPGRNYPVDRIPVYDPTPSLDAARSRTLSSPPSAAGATRVASARGRSNWLEPTRPPSQVDRPRRQAVDAPSKHEDRKPSRSKTPQHAGTGRMGSSSGAKPASKIGQNRSAGGATRNPSRQGSPIAGLNRGTSSSRRFAPQQAGPKNYPVPNGGGATRRATGPRIPSRPPERVAAKSAAHKPAPPRAPAAQKPSRAKRVTIRLSGPSIGTAPHYFYYSVDLPSQVIKQADFLWMDNGAWMDDEARGVKIIESPGRHRISVLIVTRDNMEYHGSATVHVLPPGPTASAFRGATD